MPSTYTKSLRTLWGMIFESCVLESLIVDLNVMLAA
jgi:hypothetical protein